MLVPPTPGVAPPAGGMAGGMAGGSSLLVDLHQMLDESLLLDGGAARAAPSGAGPSLLD